MALETRLLQTLALLYRMQPADVRLLADDLYARRQIEWMTALAQEAQRHGCTQPGQPPQRQDADTLRRMADEDAQHIADTWNRDVERQITKLFEANRRGNRNYYFSNMEQWASDRDKWKLPQIALQSAQTTRTYAQQRFRTENGLNGGRFIFTGPPPVCQICVREFAAGIVSARYIQAHKCPRHVGCPHEWAELKPGKLACDAIWVG
jgi:hypothetical protein